MCPRFLIFPFKNGSACFEPVGTLLFSGDPPPAPKVKLLG